MERRLAEPGTKKPTHQRHRRPPGASPKLINSWIFEPTVPHSTGFPHHRPLPDADCDCLSKQKLCLAEAVTVVPCADAVKSVCGWPSAVGGLGSIAQLGIDAWLVDPVASLGSYDYDSCSARRARVEWLRLISQSCSAPRPLYSATFGWRARDSLCACKSSNGLGFDSSLADCMRGTIAGTAANCTALLSC
jgi:hypothetical protein